MTRIVNNIKIILCFICHCGSGVEQLTRNEQAVGSIPTSGSKETQLYHYFGNCVVCLLRTQFERIFVKAAHRINSPGSINKQIVTGTVYDDLVILPDFIQM